MVENLSIEWDGLLLRWECCKQIDICEDIVTFIKGLFPEFCLLVVLNYVANS
jgi:hypothetical protein